MNPTMIITIQTLVLNQNPIALPPVADGALVLADDMLDLSFAVS
jgi:hypothetical protein